MDWRVELRFGVFWQGEAVMVRYGALWFGEVGRGGLGVFRCGEA